MKIKYFQVLIACKDYLILVSRCKLHIQYAFMGRAIKKVGVPPKKRRGGDVQSVPS